jgi:hypothetical protein
MIRSAISTWRAMQSTAVAAARSHCGHSHNDTARVRRLHALRRTSNAAAAILKQSRHYWCVRCWRRLRWWVVQHRNCHTQRNCQSVCVSDVRHSMFGSHSRKSHGSPVATAVSAPYTFLHLLLVHTPSSAPQLARSSATHWSRSRTAFQREAQHTRDYCRVDHVTGARDDALVVAFTCTDSPCCWRCPR